MSILECEDRSKQAFSNFHGTFVPFTEPRQVVLLRLARVSNDNVTMPCAIKREEPAPVAARSHDDWGRAMVSVPGRASAGFLLQQAARHGGAGRQAEALVRIPTD
jgi:hypothetical protein